MILAVVFLFGLSLNFACARLSISGEHFYYNGHRVFLNGVNQAWVSYGYDWGNNQYQYRKDKFQSIIQQLQRNGGNSIRVWVHVEGQTSPKFDHSGHVAGTDNSNTLISELRQYLQFARQHNVFVFLCLWNGAEKSSGNEKLQGLVKDTGKLRSYINHALIPMVNALKNEPALGGWDIINEMEGVITPGQYSSEPCFDTRALSNPGAGWKGHLYSAQELLRFINWQAAAIRKADPQALVTAGSWNPKSNSNADGHRNYYSDNCLIKAGHDNQGKLNFFSTHTYDNSHHTFDTFSPFRHPKSFYQLGNVPLVVAEFNQVKGGGWTIDGMFPYLYNHGYAGAWSWHANADGTDTDTLATQLKGVNSISGKNDQHSGGLVRVRI